MTPCIYCGCPATTIDHIPPVADRAQLMHVHHFEVDACHECNSMLAARTLWTVEERKSWIKQYLKKKYRRLINSPEWTVDELDELGPKLRKGIQVALGKKALVMERIGW